MHLPAERNIINKDKFGLPYSNKILIILTACIHVLRKWSYNILKDKMANVPIPRGWSSSWVYCLFPEGLEFDSSMPPIMIEISGFFFLVPLGSLNYFHVLSLFGCAMEFKCHIASEAHNLEWGQQKKKKGERERDRMVHCKKSCNGGCHSCTSWLVLMVYFTNLYAMFSHTRRIWVMKTIPSFFLSK